MRTFDRAKSENQESPLVSSRLFVFCMPSNSRLDSRCEVTVDTSIATVPIIRRSLGKITWFGRPHYIRIKQMYPLYRVQIELLSTLCVASITRNKNIWDIFGLKAQTCFLRYLECQVAVTTIKSSREIATRSAASKNVSFFFKFSQNSIYILTEKKVSHSCTNKHL